MAMTRWTPTNLMRLADRLVEEMDATAQNGGDRVARLSIDAYETDESIVIEASVPGVDAESIDIRMDGDVLTIQGESPLHTEAANYLLRERFSGKFGRTLKLNVPVEVEQIDATVDNGILTVMLPKAEIARPAVIKVRTNR